MTGRMGARRRARSGVNGPGGNGQVVAQLPTMPAPWLRPAVLRDVEYADCVADDFSSLPSRLSRGEAARWLGHKI